METFPLISTARLDLIEITQAHLCDIYQLFMNENVTRYYNLLPFKKESDAQNFLNWVQTRFKDKVGIRWGIALKGTSTIIGTIGFNNYSFLHKALIGYDLREDHWNQGYVSEALKEVVKYGFIHLRVNRIEAEVMQGNVVSEKVLEKLHFQKEGVLRQWLFWNGRYYDMTMFALLKKDFITSA